MANKAKRSRHKQKQIPKNNREETRPNKQFDAARIISYWALPAVFCITISLNNFKFIEAFSRPSFLVQQLGLFFTFLLLAIRWISATNSELALWKRWLVILPPTLSAYFGIFFIATGMGLSLAYSYSITISSIIFTVFLLLNYWTQWLANDYFKHALQMTRSSSSDQIQLAVLHVMERYWLQRPQLARITSLMFVSAMAFSFALAGAVLQKPKSHSYETVAYVILIASVLISELIIAWWRYKRNREIARAKTGQNTAIAAQPAINQISPDDAAKSDFGAFKGAAYAMILAIGGTAIGVTIEPFKFMWTSFINSPGTPLYITRIALFLFIFILVALWVIQTQFEMGLWLRMTNPPFGRKQIYIAIVILAVVLGLALAFAYNIIFISLLMTVYFLINYWGAWICEDHFAQALSLTRSDTHQNKISADTLNAMEYYWLRRPHLGRIVTLMFFASMSFALALTAGLGPEEQRQPRELAAYVVLIADIVAGEILINYWRFCRDRSSS
ncbi:MAG TPA: hypothetical protein VFK06_12425 [Candidatus Angelobacter sp.]|nr:hypothetical protein [Candidatus Angelobacter sp.]